MHYYVWYASSFTFLAIESHACNSQGLILYFSDDQFSLKALNSAYKAYNISNDTGGSYSANYVHKAFQCVNVCRPAALVAVLYPEGK